MKQAFKPGDVVEATRGTRRIIDVVTVGAPWHNSLCLGEPQLFGPSCLESFIACGYELTVLEPAHIPPLPKGIVKWPHGPVAAWTDDGMHWMITGSERAWGDPNEIIDQYGTDFEQIA